jgi:beta-lactam-binding protein with PASTA domain
VTRLIAVMVLATALLLGPGCGKDAPQVAVPTVTGKQFPEARRVAEAAKLTVVVAKREYNDAPLGQVLAQDPASGRLAEGKPINLTVSKGPLPGP